MKLVDGQHRARRRDHSAWCQALFGSLKDGGRWGVPRSGLTFQRQGAQLVLVDRAPGFDALVQQSDYEATRTNFALAGIVVSDNTQKGEA